jgi:purine-binding chemotaxis protein CheW
MGRMADARKRARQGGGAEAGKRRDGEEAPAPAEERRVEPEPQAAADDMAAPPETAWVARDESFVFPADTPSTAPTRIALPSSGLAADILALAEAAAVPESEAAPLAVAAAEEAPDTSARAHNISFFASPGREEKRAVEATEHLATFFLGREEYGVDVRLVQEIIRVSEITQVPRAPGFIKGVINLRGRIIPVVDLRRKLNLGEVELTKHSRIVVVKVRDRLVGLLVDGASQVLKVAVSTIEQAPEEVVEIDANYIRGVAKLQTRLIILMDLQKILAMELRESAAPAPA